MPSAPLKHCHRPGHPLYSGRRCPMCAREHDRKRGTARQRGYDADWERVRAGYLKANPTCCEPGCSARAVDVDHKVSVKEAPHRRLDPTNLRGFCKSHHAKRTSRDQIGRDEAGRFAEGQDGGKGIGVSEFASLPPRTVGGSRAQSPGKWDFLL